MQVLQRIRDLMESQGLNVKRLAERAKADYRNLSEVMNGKRNLGPSLLAKVSWGLRVTVEELTQSASPNWTKFHKSNADRLGLYQEQLTNAKTILTLMKSVDSFFQEHEWMLEWSNRDWLEVENWENHKNLFLPYVKQQRSARERSNAVQRLVCPVELFETARIENVHWLEEIRHGLGRFEEVACVTPVRDWVELQKTVSTMLPAAEWDKLCIIDASTAYIHLDDQYYSSCSHQPTVEALTRHCEQAVHSQQSLFPVSPFERRPKRRTLKQLTFEIQNQIETFLANRSTEISPRSAELSIRRILRGSDKRQKLRDLPRSIQSHLEPLIFGENAQRDLRQLASSIHWEIQKALANRDTQLVLRSLGFAVQDQIEKLLVDDSARNLALLRYWDFLRCIQIENQSGTRPAPSQLHDVRRLLIPKRDA